MAKRNNQDAEPEEATGYFYTHVDCPGCDFVIAVESDARGDILECPDCKMKVLVTEVR